MFRFSLSNVLFMSTPFWRYFLVELIGMLSQANISLMQWELFPQSTLAFFAFKLKENFFRKLYITQLLRCDLTKGSWNLAPGHMRQASDV